VGPSNPDLRYVKHLCRRAKIQRIITVLLSYAVVLAPPLSYNNPHPYNTIFNLFFLVVTTHSTPLPVTATPITSTYAMGLLTPSKGDQSFRTLIMCFKDLLYKMT